LVIVVSAVLFYHADRQTKCNNDRHTDAAKRLTPATVVGVNKYAAAELTVDR